MLFAAGILFLSQFSLTLLLDLVFPGVRFPELANVNKQLESSTFRPDITVVGSSHLQGVQTAIAEHVFRKSLQGDVPKTFNGSVSAGDPVIWDRLFARWVEKDKLPRLLLVEISPETLNRNDPWIGEQVVRILDWRDSIDVAPSLCRGVGIMRLISDRFAPIHRHRYQIRKQLGNWLFDQPQPPLPTGQRIDTLGKDPEPPALSPEILEAMRFSTLAVRHSLRDYSPTGVTAERLERLLENCRSHHIHVILFAAPMPTHYRAGYTPESESGFVRYIDELKSRYGCVFVDWRDQMPDEFFRDSTHLNPAGNHILSRRMSQEILLPMWKEIARSPEGHAASK